MRDEIVITLYGDEKITLTLGDLKRLIDKKIELATKADLEDFGVSYVHKITHTLQLGAIYNLFFFMAKDAIEGKIPSDKFIEFLDKLGMYVNSEEIMERLEIREENKKNEEKLEEDALKMWHISKTDELLFALKHIVVVFRGYGEERLVYDKIGEEEVERWIIPSNREDWAESFKKTLKELGMKEYERNKI